MLYAALKGGKLMNRDNPNVSSFLERGAITTREKVNINDVNMQFAFGVEGFIDKKMKDDIRYVKGLARIRGSLNGEAYEHILPYHRCT